MADPQIIFPGAPLDPAVGYLVSTEQLADINDTNNIRLDADQALLDAASAQTTADQAVLDAAAAQTDAAQALVDAAAAQVDATQALNQRFPSNPTVLYQGGLVFPPFGASLSGRVITQAIRTTRTTFTASAANRVDLVPFLSAVNVVVDQISVEVTTAVGGDIKVGVYSTDPTDPTVAPVLVYESGSVADTPNGLKDFTPPSPITFTGNTLYWWFCRTSAIPTMRVLAADTTLGWPRGVAINNRGFQLLRGTLTYGTAMPDPYNLTLTETIADPSAFFLRIA